MLRTSLVGGLPDDQIAEMLGLKNLQAGLSDILDGTALINKLNADINEPFDGRDYPVGSHRHTGVLPCTNSKPLAPGTMGDMYWASVCIRCLRLRGRCICDQSP